MNKIISIEKNYGEYNCFSVNNGLIDEIKEENKCIGEKYILVYRGYKDKKLYFEIEAGSGVTIIYEI